LKASEGGGWRMSLTRHRHFDPYDVAGTETAEGFEGTLVRKYTFEPFGRKSTQRSWDKMYFVIRGNQLFAYKDQRHREDDEPVRGETPINLVGCTAEVAAEYQKRRHVFSLRLGNGAEYLFQARDDEDMYRWLQHLQAAIGQQQEAAGRSSTLPPSQQPPPKKKGFFTLKKK